MAAPFRSDAGIQTTQQASWTGATGVPGLYYQTGVGMRVRKPDNTEFTIGAGGGSTTLAATYAAGASTTDSIFALDATRGALIFRDNATPIGTIVDIQASTAVSKFKFDASNMTFGANRGILTTAGNGAFDFSSATGIFKTSTGSHTFGSAAWGVPANLVVTGAASSTNTTGMSHVANVADGATSVAHDFNNATTLANAAASLLRVRNNGTTLLTTLLNNSDGVALVDGGGQSSLRLSTNAGTVLGYGGATYAAGSGSITMGDGTGSINMSAGTVTATVIKIVPDADGTRDFGLVGTRWRTIAGKRFVPGLFVVTPSATPAFDPANGNKQRMILTANVTSWTFAAGAAGESVTLEFIQDGTGTRTLAGTPANVKLAGAALTLSTGINKRDLITFEYDTTDSNWYEQSRSLNC